MTFIEALQEFESLRDINPTPTCWQEAMQAVVAGAVDFDDIEPLCEACAEVGDIAIDDLKKQSCETGMDITPRWTGVLNAMLPALGTDNTDLLENFVRMGAAADVGERIEAGVAS